MAARTHNSPSWHCMGVASNPSASGSSLQSPGQKYWMFKPTGLPHSRDVWCVHVVCSMWPVLLWGYCHSPVVLRGKISFFTCFFSVYLFQNDIREKWCAKRKSGVLQHGGGDECCMFWNANGCGANKLSRREAMWKKQSIPFLICDWLAVALIDCKKKVSV